MTKDQTKAADFRLWSEQVAYLIAAPQSARTLKAAEHLVRIASTTGERLRAVTARVAEYKDLLAGLGVEPGDVVTLGDVTAPSAHEAVIRWVQAWYFALWSEVDFAGWLKAQTGQAVLFDPQAIARAPEKAVCYCRGFSAVDAAGVLARLRRERALVGAKLACTTDARAGTTARPTSANARMVETIERRPEAKAWTARQWATHLGVSSSTVCATKAWTTLVALREESREDLLLRQNSPPKRGRRMNKRDDA